MRIRGYVSSAQRLGRGLKLEQDGQLMLRKGGLLSPTAGEWIETTTDHTPLRCITMSPQPNGWGVD